MAQSFGEILGGLAFKDDIFTAVAAVIEIPSSAHTFANGTTKSDAEQLTWGDHNSHYQLTYKWHITTAQDVPEFRGGSSGSGGSGGGGGGGGGNDDDPPERPK